MAAKRSKPKKKGGAKRATAAKRKAGARPPARAAQKPSARRPAKPTRKPAPKARPKAKAPARAPTRKPPKLRIGKPKMARPKAAKPGKPKLRKPTPARPARPAVGRPRPPARPAARPPAPPAPPPRPRKVLGAAAILKKYYAGEPVPCPVDCGGGNAIVVRVSPSQEGGSEMWMECLSCAQRAKYRVAPPNQAERDKVIEMLNAAQEPVCVRHARRVPLQRLGRQLLCPECGIRYRE